MKSLPDFVPGLVCRIISEKAGLEGVTHFDQSCSVDVRLFKEAVKDAVSHERTLIEPLTFQSRQGIWHIVRSAFFVMYLNVKTLNVFEGSN